MRNPLTVNKDNFIQDLRFRVLFENVKYKSKVNDEDEPKLNTSNTNYRYRSLNEDDTEKSSDVNKWILEIRKFSKKDEGCYQCQLNSFRTKTIHYCVHIQSNYDTMLHEFS